VCPGRYFSFTRTVLSLGLFLTAATLYAQDVWSGPPFSADPQALRRAAAEIKADKDADVTILLNEYSISIDSTGKVSRTHHWIYRIETPDAVEGWAEIEGDWDPWYQAKPEIRARVITNDGVVHALDPKTLNDVPVHENSPDVYSDGRSYGGPLPALAAGAIAEEEIITRDTAVFSPAGDSERYSLGHNVPANKTRVVLSHPESLPFRYVLHLLPDAVITKSTANGFETIVIEQGPMAAYEGRPSYAPPEAVLVPTLEFTTGTSWQQVASIYARQINDKFRIPDVQPVIAKLELRKDSNLDAIRKLVSTLHRDVRYTGVEFGESSLIPQFPSETLKRKYGDCKDKATVLITMLRAAGIPSSLALLSAGPGRDVNPEMPGIGDFDHAIVYVPATASSPELWIDATAQYSRVGDLPDMDYGRWALIADEKTTGLTRIPELISEKNRHVETREFLLADFGAAKILERNEQFGPMESDYRDYYNGDPKKIRESSEKYIKDAYATDSLLSMEKTDPADLEKPFIVTFTAKGKRGYTDIDNAQVYVPYAGIFDDLPLYFRTRETEKPGDPGGSAPKPRTVDWVITPSITEWHYKITAPAGFKVRALPPNKEETLGTATFGQKYWSSQDGAVVEAVLSFDTGKARLTIKEAAALRDAIVKEQSADGITISFGQTGYSLLVAGKIKEALTIDRQLVADYPKEPLHRVRLARAFLEAGLGEQARTAIREASVLDPKSPQVFTQQGWILEHDLIGRRFHKGFEYNQAVAAYRKAKQLDPKDNQIRAYLALLLEYDAEGLRYTKEAHLEEAVTEFQELKKLDEDYARRYDDFVAYDFWYLGKYKELNEYVSGLPATDIRKSFIVATIAATDSAEAAVKKSIEITSQEQEKSNVLTTAGQLLLHVRKYPQAAELLASGTHGQSNESGAAPFIAALRKTKPIEELEIDNSSPIGVVQEMFVQVFSGSKNFDQLESLFTRTMQQSPGFKSRPEDGPKTTFELRSVAEKSGITVPILADLTLSTAHFITEGDDKLGYKITIETLGGVSQDVFVVREEGGYKLADFSSVPTPVPENIGWEVVARLAKHDLVGARRWLDWAREKVHINTGDDPLSGQPFPHFWTKGQDADEVTVRTAALVLLPSKELKGENLAALIEARNNTKSDDERARLNLVLAYAYSAQQKWTELLEVADELLKKFPDSITAFRFVTSAYAGLKQFDAWDKLVQVEMEKHRDEADYIRSAAGLAQYRGQFAKARELLKGLIDRGKGTSNDLNSYAWDALFISSPVDQDALDTALRASELTKSSKFGILHTLACLYAAVGKTKESHQFLLQAMDEAKLEEPDSSIWLGLAIIAEQYGETEAARTMYGRVDKPGIDHPASSYALAQQHLAALQNSAVSTKAAGQ